MTAPAAVWAASIAPGAASIAAGPAAIAADSASLAPGAVVTEPDATGDRLREAVRARYAAAAVAVAQGGSGGRGRGGADQCRGVRPRSHPHRWLRLRLLGWRGLLLRPGSRRHLLGPLLRRRGGSASGERGARLPRLRQPHRAGRAAPGRGRAGPRVRRWHRRPPLGAPGGAHRASLRPGHDRRDAGPRRAQRRRAGRGQCEVPEGDHRGGPARRPERRRRDLQLRHQPEQ